jgi:hypothetical protein
MCQRIKLKLVDMTNWPPIRMMYRPNFIMRNHCRLFEHQTISHCMSNWCWIAHDHAEIDAAP